MKINLNPTQKIYNKLSKAVDGYEKNLIKVCQQIKERIFDIIGDYESYEPNTEITDFDGDDILKTVKGLIYAVYTENEHDMSMVYKFDSVIRLLFIHEVTEQERSENPKLQLIRDIQSQPFTCLSRSLKLELDTLLKMWINCIEHIENEPTTKIDHNSLPIRNSVDVLGVKKGITKREWLKVAG